MTTTRPAREIADEIDAATREITELLHYPVDHRGRVYDVRFLAPWIGFHLARAGMRWHPELAVIKKRRLPPAPGVVEDAVEWVHPDAPDSIEDELAGATLDDLGRLSAAARAELVRRLGANPDVVAVAAAENLDGRTPWHVETSIQFDDDDEENN